jgi:hypothetical protein
MKTIFKIFLFAFFTFGIAILLAGFAGVVLDKQDRVWCDKHLDFYVNKGMTKLGKEFRDLVPVANLESQFDNLLTSGNFYFK